MRRVKRVLSSLLLLTLFTVYQAGITMFTHVHYVNGVMIAHSHPSHGKHTHTKTEIVVIDRLSSFHSLEADIPVNVIDPVRPLLFYVEVQPETPVVLGMHLQGTFSSCPRLQYGLENDNLIVCCSRYVTCIPVVDY